MWRKYYYEGLRTKIYKSPVQRRELHENRKKAANGKEIPRHKMMATTKSEFLAFVRHQAKSTEVGRTFTLVVWSHLLVSWGFFSAEGKGRYFVRWSGVKTPLSPSCHLSSLAVIAIRRRNCSKLTECKFPLLITPKHTILWFSLSSRRHVLCINNIDQGAGGADKAIWLNVEGSDGSLYTVSRKRARRPPRAWRYLCQIWLKVEW